MVEHAHNLFIALKKIGGEYRAILSDDSLDRDGEYMSAELLKGWAKGKGLPMLADHENRMQSFIGGWTERKLIEKDGMTALSMKPNFFSQKANPLAMQIKQQIDEASDMGVEVGLSIGFIPVEGQNTERGYMHTKAELVEGTVVPVQSNRNSYVMVAKKFNITGGSMKTKQNENGDTENSDNPDVVQAVDDLQTAITDLTDTVDEMDKRVGKLENPEDGADDTENKDDAEDNTDDADSEDDTTDTGKSIKFSGKTLKLAKELNAVKKQLSLLKKNSESSRGKIPISLLKSIMVSKEGSQTKNKEPYSAAKAYLKSKGIYAGDRSSESE